MIAGRKSRAIHLFRSHFFADWTHWTRKPTCTLEDRAVLQAAIDEYWQSGCEGLPADPANLSEHLGVTVEQVRSMLAHTTAHHEEGGVLHFHNIAMNYQKALEQSEKQSRRARARNNRSAAGDPRSNHPYPHQYLNPDPQQAESSCEEGEAEADQWLDDQ